MSCNKIGWSGKVNSKKEYKMIGIDQVNLDKMVRGGFPD